MLIIRKRLLLDTDPMELARVKLVLDKNGIEYEVKTTVAETASSRRFNMAASMTVKGGYSDVSRQSYVYYLYVSPKEYKRAKTLCYGK